MDKRIKEKHVKKYLLFLSLTFPVFLIMFSINIKDTKINFELSSRSKQKFIRVRKDIYYSLEKEFGLSLRQAELSFYHVSLSPSLECFVVVRRSIDMCLVTRNML